MEIVLLNIVNISDYLLVENGDISCDYIRSVSECETAARQLGLSDITAYGIDSTFGPPYCWQHWSGHLYFNTRSSSMTACDANNRKCLCRQNDLCAKYPCKEGEGDCDDDTECEGSLVCGKDNCESGPSDMDCCRQRSNLTHYTFCAQEGICKEGEGGCNSDLECEGSLVCGSNNCANGPYYYFDCCTRMCNNDMDCLNQECNTEKNQCRLDSYSTDWSLCSQESRCTVGEGDCDHDEDCDDSLICGTANCVNGPTGLDCCARKIVVLLS